MACAEPRLRPLSGDEVRAATGRGDGWGDGPGDGRETPDGGMAPVMAG